MNPVRAPAPSTAATAATATTAAPALWERLRLLRELVRIVSFSARPGSARGTDKELAMAVRNALEWDVQVPYERIRETVTDGIVTLEGRLDTWAQYEDVSRCIQNLEGVREVRNRLAVQPP